MLKIIMIGIIAGIISGLFSTGGGMILVPAFIYILKLNEKRAIKYIKFLGEHLDLKKKNIKFSYDYFQHFYIF